MKIQAGEIYVGISRCLTGDQVRYNGGHKKNVLICKTLSQYFRLIAFCPEVESGMNTPRPAIQLRQTATGIRCVEVNHHDHAVTDQIVTCARQQHDWLDHLCGYVFKNDSPSCGVTGVKIFHRNNYKPVGTGLFAQYIQDHYPMLPVAEAHQLSNPHQLETFIQRVYQMKRSRNTRQRGGIPHGSRLQAST